jgi:hypothetical protein
LSSFFCCCLIGVIDVDNRNFENKGEFEVFVLTDVNVNKAGVLHNGHEVVFYADVEDVMDKKFKAVLKNEHKILVQMPSLSRHFIDNSENLVSQQKAAMVHCVRTQEAHDVARNGIPKDVKRQTKHRLLRFPKDMGPLSNNIFSPDSTDGEITFEPFPLKAKYETVSSTHVRLSWKVSAIEKEKRVVKSSDRNEAGDTLLARLSGMDVSK